MTMAPSYLELKAILSPPASGKGNLKLLGMPYQGHDPLLIQFAASLAEADDFEESWPAFLAALAVDASDQAAALADAKLLLLYSHYLVTVRATAESGEYLSAAMMQWIGEGDERIPVENAQWFLAATQGHGSAGAHAAIQVISEEATFLRHFFTEQNDAAVIQAAGIYLGQLLDLRAQWPAHYQWLPMDGRMRNIRELFLLGSEELPLTTRAGKSEVVFREIVEVYDALQALVPPLPFWTMLQEYIEELRANKGHLTAAAQSLRVAMLAD